MIRRPPRSTQGVSSAASDVYKRQVLYRARPVLACLGSRRRQIAFFRYYLHSSWAVRPALFSGIKNITSAPSGQPLFSDIQNLHFLFCPIVHTRPVASCDMILHRKHLANEAGAGKAPRLFTFVDNPGRWSQPHAAGAYLSASLSAKSPACLLYTSPSPRDRQRSRMPSSA